MVKAVKKAIIMVRQEVLDWLVQQYAADDVLIRCKVREEFLLANPLLTEDGLVDLAIDVDNLSRLPENQNLISATKSTILKAYGNLSPNDKTILEQKINAFLQQPELVFKWTKDYLLKQFRYQKKAIDYFSSGKCALQQEQEYFCSDGKKVSGEFKSYYKLCQLVATEMEQLINLEGTNLQDYDTMYDVWTRALTITIDAQGGLEQFAALYQKIITANQNPKMKQDLEYYIQRQVATDCDGEKVYWGTCVIAAQLALRGTELVQAFLIKCTSEDQKYFTQVYQKTKARKKSNI